MPLARGLGLEDPTRSFHWIFTSFHAIHEMNLMFRVLYHSEYIISCVRLYKANSLYSAFDSWQAGCIFAADEVPAGDNMNGNCNAFTEWHGCIGGNRLIGNTHRCSEDMMRSIIGYEVSETIINQLINQSINQ